MMNIRSFVAASATMAVVAAGTCVYAQDDLDDLLKDLEAETAKDAVKADANAAAPKKAEPVKDVPKAEAPKAEAPKATAAAEKPAEPVVEAKAEAPKAEKPAAAVEEEVKPAAAEKPAEPAVVVKRPSEVSTEASKPAAAAPKASVAPQAPVYSGKDAELIENIRATEKLRRESMDLQAKREIAEARGCMKDEEYDEAIRHYGLAQRLLNDRPGSKSLRKECAEGIAEGLYRLALQEDGLGRREQAIKRMEQAMDMRHPKARRMLEKWNAEGEVTVKKADVSEIKHRKNDEEYVQQREQIRKHLRRGRHLLSVRDMKGALEEVEVVLVNDPYNQEAIRLREAIQKKRQVILQQERVAARDGMIADVDEAWRPVYAVNASQLNEASAETVKAQLGDDPERTMEQDIERRMKEMRLPTISFKPPATIIEAVDFFRGASKDYDRPDIPVEKRGFNFVLRTPQGALKAQGAANAEAAESDDFSSNGDENAAGSSNGLAPIPTITASDISFYEALKLVCDSVDYKFIVRGPVVMVMQKDMSTAELLSRKYNIPEAFVERVNSASEEMKDMGGGFGGGAKAKKDEDEGEGEGRDWKAFFEEMGVKWPEGSSIKHIKALGKLYVRNTRENLAEFEKVLEELGGQPQLIEIEARFVEVSQEDLNSLGFEWILNSDYSLNLGSQLGRALGVANGTFGSESGSQTWTRSLANGSGNENNASSESTTTSTREINSYQGKTVSDESKSQILNTDTTFDKTFETLTGNTDYKNTYSRNVPYKSSGANWIRDMGETRAVGVNAFGGTSSDYNRGSRYLSDTGNYISGANSSNNDQFMRVNAFLGTADLSLILHMLSQRSDTDLLSAPKVVTKSGENAVIKVVKEYIYPQDYDVQLQSSSSSGSSSSGGGSSSAILAVVEPQNFTMREVGVILDVTPTYNEANGGTIDLELKPSVVQGPDWKDYGMRIPFTGNPASGLPSLDWLYAMPEALDALTTAVTSLINSQSDTIAQSYVAAGIDSMNPNTITYYEASMEQPIFDVRMIDSKVSITPGATVVMGGLITETRKAMDDKIPYLGDLPFIGRLFRSHAEKTVKRNLLIFVTGRLITPAGRELRMNEAEKDSAEVKAAPKSEQ